MSTPSPQSAGMTDTLEFLKKLWGSMNIAGTGMPGMHSPGLSVDELDKKIADLKAVESWLNLNLGMLRGTIQALEVQRGTLATLKAMSDSMAQAMQRAGSDPAMAAPFAQFFAQAGKATPAQEGAAPQAPSSQQAERPAAPASAATDSPASQDQAGPASASAAMPAAVAWWNLLQDQFRQAVAGAMPASTAAADTPVAAPGSGAAQPGGASPAGGSPLDVSGGAPPAAVEAAGSRRVGRNPRGKADKG